MNEKREKKKEKFFKISFEFASFELQGRRPSMEDAHCIVENFGGIRDDFCVGVFDGHSGDRCSKYVKDHICSELLNNVHINNNFKQAFFEVFIKIDKNWLDLVDTKEVERNSKDEELRDLWDDGSTGVCVLYKNNILAVANVGDSRVVISRKGVAEQITVDHHPNQKDEKERLDKNGIQIINIDKLGGPNGQTLSVSRAFGDYDFKRPVFRGLIVEPDYFEIKDLEEVDFIVLGCDGLFEESSSEDLVLSIKKMFQEHLSLEEVAKAICVYAVELGSDDNISIVIIKLDVKVRFHVR